MGSSETPWPPLLPLPPQKGEKGKRKAAQEFGSSESPLPPFLKGEAQSGAELGSDRLGVRQAWGPVGLGSGRPASGRFPPLEGVPEGRGSQATIQFMNL